MVKKEAIEVIPQTCQTLTCVVVIDKTNIYKHLLTFKISVKRRSPFVARFFCLAMKSLSLSAAHTSTSIYILHNESYLPMYFYSHKRKQLQCGIHFFCVVNHRISFLLNICSSVQELLSRQASNSNYLSENFLTFFVERNKHLFTKQKGRIRVECSFLFALIAQFFTNNRFFIFT